MEELQNIHEKIKDKIEKRLKEFKENGKSNEKMLKELIFCLLTPQSKAKSCWKAVDTIFKSNEWNEKNLIKKLNGVRFKYKKAKYVIEARNKFNEIKEAMKEIKEEKEAREWLVKNIKGMGYKEASHFLRNIGKANNLAILDRHILKNMKTYGIIDEISKPITRKKYMMVEKKFIEFAEKNGLLPTHLDFILWYKETGEVFK